ncbi:MULTISPECIES: hypothetical protein [unclassified Pseudonocardia]|uniref:hypothetical protein n=1 Tax=unclassified Pseudonocardia TaxID=2619320 RepID=UPI0009669D14|nr:hypothetical protein [Pseudonocardia sp. Ae707_Ps1]OLM16788.1 hypothetical protein Ae707Ps1_1046c [Pseudonocardia sp. Ae707_Ps1]
MTIKVALWAVGSVGAEAVRQVVAHPDLELVGGLVYSADKDGVDLGTLAGIEEIGIPATANRTGVAGLDADVVLHMPMIGPRGGDESLMAGNDDDVETLLRSGKNVISISGYIWPAVHGDAAARRFHDAGVAGNATLFGTGINPGFMMDRLGQVASSLCRRVDSVFLTEWWDTNTYPAVDVLRDLIAMGRPADWITSDSPTGEMIGQFFYESLSLVAASLGGEVERFERTLEVGLATRDIVLDATGLEIPEGSIGAVAWTWSAIVDGRPFVSIQDRWVGDHEIPGWGPHRHDHWELELTGAPDVSVTVELHRPEDDEGVADPLVCSTVAIALNSIPAVRDAAPGLYRYAVPGTHVRPGGTPG